MKGRFRFIRVLAGLLCLFLLVGFLPADILGDLIPEADAAVEFTYNNIENIDKKHFNGMYIIRNKNNPELVLTSTNYTNQLGIKWCTLGSTTDIRNQIWIIRSAQGDPSSTFESHDVYIRPLREVYRWDESGHGSYGNLWLTSNASYFWLDTAHYNNNAATNDGYPEDNPSKFAFRVDYYQNVTYNGKTCMNVGLHDNKYRNQSGYSYYMGSQNCSSGDNPWTIRSDAGNSNTQLYLEPVAYNMEGYDDKALTLMTQNGSNKYYMSHSESFVANQSAMVKNGGPLNWPATWNLVRAGDGYYNIVNTNHERYLAVNNAGIVVLGNKASKSQWCKPQDAETWQIIPYAYKEQGYDVTTFLIVNKATGKLLLRSASGDNIIAGNFYKNDDTCCLWQINYSENTTIANQGFSRRNEYIQASFADTASISYPLNLSGNSSYHTLTLNQAYTTNGYLTANDKAANNNQINQKLVRKQGYLFDTGFAGSCITPYNSSTSGPSITYDTQTGVIENSDNLYRLQHNSVPVNPFKPNGSSTYSATIKFQFQYEKGMFFEYRGYNLGSLSVRVLRKDGVQLYSETTNGDNYIDLSAWCTTEGETYMIEFTKTSTSDSASHFKIFTNVKPLAIYETKDEHDRTELFDLGINVYQDGEKLALNGAAVIGTPLEYGITITNNSIYNLLVQSFGSPAPTDDATEISHWGIRNLGGFKITSAGGVTAGDAKDKDGNSIALNDLVFNVYNASGVLVDTLDNPTVDSLSQFLTHVSHNDDRTSTSYGLPTGWTIEVRGIFYQPTEADLDTYARKMVYPEATAKFHAPGISTVYQKFGDNTSVHFTNEPFFIQWAGQNITVSKELLFELIQKAGKHKYEIEDQLLAASNITSLMIANNDGSLNNTPNIAVESNTNLVLKHANAGRYQYNIKVNFNGTFAFVPIQVFVYDISEDKTFVLDYGLPVIINKESYTDDADFSQLYDKLEINDPFDTIITIDQVTGTKPGHDGTYLTVTPDLTTAYGTISLDANGNITYTPTAFLDGADYIYVVFKVARDTTSNTNLGVKVADELLMYKTITILPANVIYYEDGNDTINYPDINGIDILGDLNASNISGVQQLPDSSDSYGYDDGSFANSKDVTLSGLSYHKVPVHGEQVTVNFTFKGTGFELISRVNAFDSATILVKVRPYGGTEADWTWYPVITQFDPNGNGLTEVYQVPVFRLNNGTYGTYEVQVVGLPKAASNEYDENGNPIGGYTPNYIYIDGIRVYNPLGYDDPLTENYGNEKNAEFTNLRDLILTGQGMVTTITEENKTSQFTTGSYYYVPDEDGTLTAAMGGINELGAIGANNEILIRKSAGDNMIVLRVKDNGGGLLQVGIHDIHDAMFDGADPKSATNDPTTVHIRTTSGWTALASGIYHGTEQYYNIDLAQCPTDGTYKIVMLKVESGFASFTNVKHKNVDFGTIGEKALDIYVQPGFYINQNGDMCKIDENGNEEIVEPGVMPNLSLLNSLLQEEPV